MRRGAGFIGLAALCAMPTWSGTLTTDGLPADLAVNRNAINMTVEPKVVVNSGRLEWSPYKRNLTLWPSLSYDDKRPTSKMRKVALEGALNGNSVRGRELALSVEKGNCIACHALPRESWPGSVGLKMLHFKQNNYPDELVFQQIFDSRVFNPNTVMPPFGTLGVLNEQEIRDLVAYLQGLD